MTNDIIITNPDRRHLALIHLKARLKIEIKTGMSTSSRRGLVEAARAWGYEGSQRKATCLEWVESELAKY